MTNSNLKLPKKELKWKLNSLVDFKNTYCLRNIPVEVWVYRLTDIFQVYFEWVYAKMRRQQH